LIHLIPTGILLIILAMAWRWEWIGALVFPALGAFYIITTWGRFPWPTYLIIAGPLVLVGGLFFLGWQKHCQTTSAAGVGNPPRQFQTEPKSDHESNSNP